MCLCTVASAFDPIVSQLVPGVSVDLDTKKVSFDYMYVFKAQVGTPDWALAVSELPVQDVCRGATVLHSTNVAQPTQSALSQERVHAEETSTRKYISVCVMILP